MDIQKGVIQTVSNLVDMPKNAIFPTTSFRLDLDFDVIEVLSVIITVEMMFGVDLQEEEIRKIQTINDLCYYITKHVYFKNRIAA